MIDLGATGHQQPDDVNVAGLRCQDQSCRAVLQVAQEEAQGGICFGKVDACSFAYSKLSSVLSVNEWC